MAPDVEIFFQPQLIAFFNFKFAASPDHSPESKLLIDIINIQNKWEYSSPGTNVAHYDE